LECNRYISSQQGEDVLTRILLLIFVSAYINSVSAETIKIQSFEGNQDLPNVLLMTTLKKAGYDYDFVYGEAFVAESRIFNDLKTGDLDVVWTMTSKDMEETHSAIYFPIYKGLIGMRLGVVKRENRDLLRNVRTLSDLRKFTAGQGKTWPDTTILEHNGLKVAKTLKFPNLYYMLEGERFDYFPRGIYEPWSEVENFAELNVVVEPHLIIRYTAPFYYFVNKNNPELKRRMTEQLFAMLEDGTFDEMFFNDGKVKMALERSNIKQRTIIDLENPFLSDKTPLDNKQLWFDPLTYTD